jgi:hypothetical protein
MREFDDNLFDLSPGLDLLGCSLAGRIRISEIIHSELGTPCWFWVGRINRNGYGRAWDVRTKTEPVAHRLVYELLVGPIPAGLVLDHLCFMRCCVNPGHLEPVTVRLNTHRGKAVLFRKASDEEYAF